MQRSLIALSLLAVLPAAASASELSYSYIEGGYTRTTGVGAKVEGLAIHGSAALGTRFHVFGGYEATEIKARGVAWGTGQPFRTRIDVDQWQLGFGYNHSLSRSTDLVARVGQGRTEFEGVRHTFKTHFTEVGVRSQLSPKFEGHLYAGYDKTEGTGESGDFYGRIGGQYRFGRSWGLVADVKIGDGAEQFFIGPRLSF